MKNSEIDKIYELRDKYYELSDEEFSKLERETRWEYKEMFDVKELPTFIMMESTQTYIAELQCAIERGRPLEDEDRIDCDIIM